MRMPTVYRLEGDFGYRVVGFRGHPCFSVVIRDSPFFSRSCQSLSFLIFFSALVDFFGSDDVEEVGVEVR